MQSIFDRFIYMELDYVMQRENELSELAIQDEDEHRPSAVETNKDCDKVGHVYVPPRNYAS